MLEFELLASEKKDWEKFNSALFSLVRD